MKILTLALGISIIIAGGFFWLRSSSQSPASPTPIPQQSVTSSPNNEINQTTIIAENLDTPWGIELLPDKSFLVTERPGRVRLIDSKGYLQANPVATFSSVREIGEGGLLGTALHPNFSANQYIYFYYTYSDNGSNVLNRVVRMTYQNNLLKDEQIIVDKIPGSLNHDGGRIKFGPDGFLYITTGDAENPSQAQDINALGGKILRVTDEGKPAPGNPFSNLVYSYGHRNPEGLAWNSSGQLWETEHGRSGVLSGLDELNLIEAGKNYGWPIIQGNETRVGMETPKLNSGPSTTWAPAGAVFIRNSLFFGGLRGQTLYEAVINGNDINLKEHLQSQFGRIRDVVSGPDGLLYISTSNRDGRGEPIASDDRIVRVNPKKL